MDLPISEVVQLIDIPVKVLTGLAIVVGGYWTYFNFIQGRIYYPKLLCSVSLEVIERESTYYVKVEVQVKNVGLSRIDIKPQTALVTLTEYPGMGVIDDVFSADVSELAPFEVLTRHGWIEPGEPVIDQCFIAVPKNRQVAFGAEFRIVGKRHGRFGSRKRFEWNASHVALIGRLSNHGKGGDENGAGNNG